MPDESPTNYSSTVVRTISGFADMKPINELIFLSNIKLIINDLMQKA
jgi:hypothetical protein